MVGLPVKRERFKALVVGAGPAGVAVVGKLLDLGVSPILWVDQTFTCGRLESYRQVPSNTKVSLFIKYGQFFESFRKVWSTFPELVALKQLESLDAIRGCKLTYAADMIHDLSFGLRKLYEGKELRCYQGAVQSILKDKNQLWTVNVESDVFESERVIFATGSHPKIGSIKQTKELYLDDALQPSLLASHIITENDVVGVVGSSHSAMLVLKMLCELPASSQPRRVLNFYRTPLKYAEYLADDVIKHDNTGLKGEVADWVRENLGDCEYGMSSIQCLDGKVERINLPAHCSEEEAYASNKCDLMISAVGYARNALPSINVDGNSVSEKELYYDDDGHLYVNGQKLEGLQGCGIAFPQRVLDVDGTRELAVGFWKFIRHINRIISA